MNDYLEAIDEYEYLGPGENELFYFGTNQSLGWSSKEEFLKTLTITKISDEEFNVFKENLTGSHQPLTYGIFPDIEFFNKCDIFSINNYTFFKFVDIIDISNKFKLKGI